MKIQHFTPKLENGFIQMIRMVKFILVIWVDLHVEGLSSVTPAELVTPD